MRLPIEAVEWDDGNREHAPIRATEAEIDQAIANQHNAMRNPKGGSATHLVFGRTNGGKPLVVLVEYRETTRVARPITAWEANR